MVWFESHCLETLKKACLAGGNDRKSSKIELICHDLGRIKALWWSYSGK